MSFDKGSEWKTYNVLNSGISINTASNLCIDDCGNIWMEHGYYFGGVSVFNPDSAIQTVGTLNERLIDKKDSGLRIYPNPVKDELFINLNLHDEKINRAEIYNVRGKLMQVIPDFFLENKNSVYRFEIQSNLCENQVLILRLKTNKSNIISGKFLYAK